MRRWSRLLLVAVIALIAISVGALVPVPAGAVSPSDTPVFINELHYDNAGADVGEFVEIAGPAGTDLAGWSIVLYNGSNGGVYANIALSGSIPDQDGGFGTLSFAQAGIQNGSPDAVALVDDNGAVIELLSYEGVLTAIDGPAAGLSSTDIGVSESSSTLVGSSLSKTGTGTLAGDFTWQAPAAESPGAVNGGQDFGAEAPFISEIHYDNAGADTGEFVEIEGPAGTDLTGWTLVPYNGSAGTEYSATALTGSIDDEGAGRGAVSFPIAGLQNGSPDGVALVDPGGAVVEFLSYEGSFTATDGPANGSTSTDIGVSEPGSTPIGQSLQLVEGAWTGPVPESPGVLNAAVAPEAPVIAEIHYDNDGADVGEFIEVEGPAATDLTGWSIVLYNGSNGASYDTIALTGTIDDEGSGRGAVSFPPSGGSIQNGSPDGVALVDPGGAVVEFLSYEGSLTATDGPASGLVSTDIGVAEPSSTPVGQSLQLLGGAWTGPAAASPGVLNGAAPPQMVPIHEVQGSGPVAALNGQTVTVQGIVTSLFTRDDVLDGFFVQEEDADVDADPATSEGIFIFCRFGVVCPAALAAGDQVTVTGSVTEFFNMSQIDTSSGSIVIESSGNPLPAPVPVALPAAGRTDAPDTFEATEAMLVAIGDKLVVSEYFQLGRYGQVVLTADARPLQFTGTNAPSVAGFTAFQEDLATRRIILDDDNNDQNDTTSDGPDEIYPWPTGGLSTTNFFRGGDSITGLTGVLHWSFAGQTGTDAWRIRPVDGIDNIFAADNPRPSSPGDVGGRLQVASFNVLNYFTTLDEPGAVCGPSSIGCRGANSTAELDRQRAKIVAAMAEIDADILGLVEIENDGGAAANDLVAALNAATSAGTYAALDTGAIGGDAIKVAIIYQPASVSPVGAFAVLDSSVDSRFIDTKNRPVLIQTFDEVATGARLTVAVNHLKSKGSPCDDVGDPGLGDGQGNCNGTRTAAAQAMADYLATDPTGSGDGDVLIIGDLNAYAMEDPITALEAAGYTDLIEAFEGPSAYSFVFDGQLGYLDHALANGSLLPQVTGVSEWHINADEINLLDYNDDIQDSGEASFERESSNGGLDLFDPDPYRSSDHDPVIIGLDLSVPVPSCNGVPATIIGTDAGERIRGTSGPDVIVALGGNDVIFGNGGDDLICAGDGKDEVHGGRGNDTIFGEDGRDLLNGGVGRDTLDGGAEADTIYGGSGVDALDGGAAADVLYGGSGADALVGGPGKDRLYGGRGGDDLAGGDDRDEIFGGAGADTAAGGDGDDRVFGGSGRDTLDGGPGIDTLSGGGGIDTCTTGENLQSCEL